MSEGELILYTTEDGTARVQLRAIDAAAWLPQAQIAERTDEVEKLKQSADRATGRKKRGRG